LSPANKDFDRWAAIKDDHDKASLARDTPAAVYDIPKNIQTPSEVIKEPVKEGIEPEKPQKDEKDKQVNKSQWILPNGQGSHVYMNLHPRINLHDSHQGIPTK
jgi:hypothetical protein